MIQVIQQRPPVARGFYVISLEAPALMTQYTFMNLDLYKELHLNSGSKP